MQILNTIDKLLNTTLINEDLKYCFVSKDKNPYKTNGSKARVNCIEDFVEFEELLQSKRISRFSGVGISIQASNICAIDLDKCVKVKNDITSLTEQAKNILDLFKYKAYCEFSFSGTGIRILFRSDVIEEYSENYYIKNQENQIEYYQPNKSYRYVTVTGNTIYNNVVQNVDKELYVFLEKYMRKEKKNFTTNITYECTSFEEATKRTKKLYLKNSYFQDLWFGFAPGSNKNESELDYQILSMLYEYVSKDKNLIKELFESSFYFKSKDEKHIYKWNYNNNRYFEYIYNNIRR